MTATAFPATGCFAANAPKQPRSVLPIYSMGHQTEHLIDKQQHRRHNTRRVLGAFVVALTAALACAMLLLVSTGAAYAMPGFSGPTIANDTGVAAAAAFAITASVLASFVVVRMSLPKAG